MRTFRTLVFIALTVGLALPGRAAPPDAVIGLVYHESTRSIARSSGSQGVEFFADGTYAQLYVLGSGLLSPTPALLRLGDPGTGTFEYRRTSDTRAELKLVPAGQSPDNISPRILTFSTDTEGRLISLSLDGSFELIPRTTAPLVNCSNRSFVRAGGQAFAGFVITGAASRSVLVRAVGPGLAAFNISDFLKNPAVQVTRTGDEQLQARNDDWSEESAAGVRKLQTLAGAFALPEGSRDAVVFMRLGPGAYVAQVNSPDATDSGQVILEVYLLP